MTLEQQAKELGEKLAESTIPKELKREILEQLPKFSTRELGLVLYALRSEVAQLALLEKVLQDFEDAQIRRAPEIRAALRAVADAAITQYIALVEQDAVKRSAGLA